MSGDLWAKVGNTAVELAGLILALGVLYALRFLVDYIRLKMSKEVALTVVRSLRQYQKLTKVESAQLKATALAVVPDILSRFKISLPHELIDRLIEEGVNVINAEVVPVVETTLDTAEKELGQK